jgi:hypothetical protein
MEVHWSLTRDPEVAGAGRENNRTEQRAFTETVIESHVDPCKKKSFYQVRRGRVSKVEQAKRDSRTPHKHPLEYRFIVHVRHCFKTALCAERSSVRESARAAAKKFKNNKDAMMSTVDETLTAKLCS